ncbi:MAG: histidine phosphatase family protein [Candidatus Omnitrophica bacterium]|nr:histidine phosphatase family protein [Candidatus Omnitrophota bacterium]MDD5591747.1 histidine phosphatase family protein [Candidatus Omnitrophota bacterium]
MATRLFLIRHGSTDWNVLQRYCGFINIALNARGKIQAKRLQRRLKNETVHKVYASDRKRAIQTAEIVFKGRDVEKVADLREMHFGIFEGLTYKQIMEKFPRIYKKWAGNPFANAIPSGESLTILKKRVVKAFKRIILCHPNQTIAVVCHGGAISAFINHVLKSKEFWKHIPDSASLTIMDAKNKKIKIRLLNDISHLSGLKIDAVKFKKG